ncbi:MAG: Stp1/IreP family PP2C-type Ser/Thr phosphatase [Pygmaiobacter sp.]
MKIVGKTDIGTGRTENQDNYRAGRMRDDTAWAVVCDGMGGAAAGALASSVAVTVLEEELVCGLQSDLPTAGIRELLEKAVRCANSKVFSLSQAEIDKRGMGTTLVAAVLKNNKIHIVHAGDSRAYLFHGGMLDRLTKDHSIVQELVENGTLTEAEAASHPKKNLITRALGVQETLELDYSERQLRAGDVLLLCSDGLTNAAAEEELCKILEKTEFFDTAKAMIQLALSADGQDNITALLVKAEQAEEK